MELEKNGTPQILPVKGSFTTVVTKDDTTVRCFAMIETPNGPQVVGSCEAHFTDPNVARALGQFLIEAAGRLAGSSIVVPTPVVRN